MSLDAALVDAVRGAVRDELAELVGPRRLAWTVEEVADSLGTSADTVRRLIADGHLSTVPHVGRRQLVPVAALEEFVSPGSTGPALSVVDGAGSPRPERPPRAGERGADPTASPGASGDAA